MNRTPILNRFGWAILAFAMAMIPRQTPGETKFYKDLELTVVDAETEAPLPGAKVEYRGNTYTSDEQGNMLLPLEIKHWGFYFFVRADSYTPRRIATRNPTPEPSQFPSHHTVIMRKGVTIGGTVVNQEGQPIAGATIYLHETRAGRDDDKGFYEDIPYLLDEEAITDAHGAWVYHLFPAGHDIVSLRLAHPDYIGDDLYRSYDNDLAALKAQSFVLTMKKGLSLQGVVVDPDGIPVAGTLVLQGEDRFGSHYPDTTTDRNGVFTFPQVKSGKTVLTVVKPGWAPELVAVNVPRDSSAPVSIRLKPGNRVELTVLDPAGKPVHNAKVWPDSWRDREDSEAVIHQKGRKYRTLEGLSDATRDGGPLRYNGNTDKNGHFVWTWAPEDSVKYSVLKSGWAALRNVTLSARENKKTVTLYPELFISGHVTDKESGEDIASFQVFPAHAAEPGAPDFIKRDRVQGKRGRYAIAFDDTDNFFWVKAEAKGYVPAVSRPIALEEGKATVDFALEKAKQIVIRVEDIHGAGVPGATAYLVDSRTRLHVENGRTSNPDKFPQAISDDSGVLSFNFPDDEAFLVVVFSDAGFGYCADKELARGKTLTVEPWAKLKVEVASQGAPSAKRHILLTHYVEDPCIRQFLSFSYFEQIGTNGMAEISRVLPDSFQASVGVAQPEEPDGSRTIKMVGTQDIELQPGEIKSIRFEL